MALQIVRTHVILMQASWPVAYRRTLKAAAALNGMLMVSLNRLTQSPGSASPVTLKPTMTAIRKRLSAK